MALIKCPECKREISDKAKVCIHCGYPLENETDKDVAYLKCSECGQKVPNNIDSCPYCGCPIEIQKREIINNISGWSIKEQRQKKLNKKIIPIVTILAVIMIISVVIYNVKVIRPRKLEAQNKATYEEAIGLLEKGKYEEANDLLEKIDGYKDVSSIREELKYESCAYSAVNAVKEILKNPDSISVYDVNFYNGRESSQKDKDEDIDTKERDTVIDADYPYIVIHLGAQNGFGGNTESYASCIYDKNNGEYKLDTYTNELDIDKLDEDDDNYFMYLLGATIINGYYDDGIEVGNIDMGRFKTLLKNDAYSSIKIIE